MILVYTHHAVKQPAERELEREWVERVVHAPSFTDPDPNDPTVTRLFGPVRCPSAVIGFSELWYLSSPRAAAGC